MREKTDVLHLESTPFIPTMHLMHKTFCNPSSSAPWLNHGRWNQQHLRYPVKSLKTPANTIHTRFSWTKLWLVQKDKSGTKKESNPSSGGSVLTCRWKQPIAKSRVYLHLRTTSCHQWKIKCQGKLLNEAIPRFCSSFVSTASLIVSSLSLLFFLFFFNFSCRHIWN